LFGLHDNANISSAIADTNLLLDTALSLQPRTSGGAGKSWEETLTDLAYDIETRLPAIFDEEQANLSFPVDYNESMNTVLTQELGRFNKLVVILQKSLKEVQKAIKGLVVMSGELEEMGNSMVNGQVPTMWSGSAYPSLKPLGSWVNDLLQRLIFLQTWIDDLKAPTVFWISGFFFTQAFITGTMQNYARKHKIPIDQVAYDMRCLFKAECDQADVEKPDDGSIVKGLFMEGADWDFENGWMVESKPKELFISMPYVHLMPKEKKTIELIEDKDVGGTAHVYECPVYKTSFRQGMLSTTGHSTNFVMFIRLLMHSDDKSKHWVKRGAAMLTQLDD
jgi:dynein heavy chain